jgi:hypothetical protein
MEFFLVNSTTSPSNSAPADASAPNRYDLKGDGISVTYFPSGHGPATTEGLVMFSYQDPKRSLIFRTNELRRVDVADLGTIVSVTVQPAVDENSTTFSFLEIGQSSSPGASGASGLGAKVSSSAMC